MAQTIKLKRSSTGGAVPSTSSLSLGEVAINTYDGKMYIKKNDGTDAIVQVGGDSSSAVWKSYDYTATSNQTSFSGNDNNSESLSYVAGFVQVFLNGILLDPAVDYAASTGTSIVLTSGASTGDLLQIESFTQIIGTGDILVDTFPVSSTQTAFTLSQDPINKSNISVYVEGVYQESSTYSLSTTTLTLSESPANGTTVEVVIGTRNVTLDGIADLTISGTLHAGALDLGDANIINVNEISLDTIKGDADANTNITFAGSDVTTFTQGGQERLRLNTTGAQVTGNIVVSGTVDGRDVAADGVTADAALSRAGGAMGGAITTNSTFDGRDVSVDGTKLDGIESGATADQTDVEIRAAVESASDSNVFTNADHSKLDGIEALADVTDATNVTAAGALMDSEVTNLAQVKAFDSSDYATAAQGTTANAALPKAGGTMSGALNMGSQNITNIANLTSPSGSPLVLTGDSGANIELYGSGGSNNIYMDAAQVNYRGTNGSGTGSIAIGTTVVIDGSRNLTNIGTISSGAITSTGDFSTTGSITSTDGSGSFGISGDSNSNTYLIATGEIRVRPSGTSVNKLVIGSNGNITTAGTISSGAITTSGNVSVGGSAYTTATDLNLLGDGISIKNDKAGSNNNWSLIQNTDTGSASNLSFTTGLGVALTLNHNKSATFGGPITGTTATASGGTNTTALASTAFVQQEITTLIGGAPANLDTLNELAAAINDEASYAAGITNLLTLKAPLASPAFNSGATNVVASFTSTDGYGGIQLADPSGNVELTAVGNDFHIQNAGAAAKMVVLNTGNVGIGTTSPSKLLTVHYAAPAYNTVDDVLRLVNKFTSTNNAASALAGSGPAIVFAGGIGDNQTRDRARIVAPYEGSNVSGLAFHTQNTADIITEKMRIQNNGNVGIGTTTPDQKLSIKGRVSSDLADSYYGAWFEGNSATNGYSFFSVGPWYNGAGYFQRKQGTTYSHIYEYAANHHIVLQAGYGAHGETAGGGNVGIGTTSPSYKFDVYGTDDITMRIHRPSSGLALTDTCGIGFSHRGDTNTSTSDTRAAIVSTYNGSLYLCTEPGGNLNSNPVDHAALSIVGTTQNVGIGTDTPDAKLRIDQDVGTVGLKVTGGSGGTNIAEFIRDVGATTTIGINGSGAEPQMYFTSTANTFAMGVNGSNFEIADNTTIGTNSRLTIDTAGKVGIGTASPDHPLEVVGAISSADTGLQKATFANVGNDLVMTANAGATNVSSNIIFKSSQSGGAAAERMRIDSNGHLRFMSQGAGTQNNSSINNHTNNYMYFMGGSAGAMYQADNSGVVRLRLNSTTMELETASTPRISIAADGLTTLSGVTTVSSGYLNVVNGGGGQISLGDYSNTNPIGISEGLWNTVGSDNDFLTVYARNSFNIRGYPNVGGQTSWLSLTATDMVLPQDQKLQAGGFSLNDDKYMFFGTSDDARIRFDGTDSLYITCNNGTADKLKTNANTTMMMQANGNQLLTMIANSEVVINNDNNDINFRVASDTNTHMLFVDAANSGLTIGNTVVNPASGFAAQAGFGYSATGQVQIAATSNLATLVLGQNQGTNGSILDFRKQGNIVGSISVTGAGTTYNTTSDLRLKDNIETITDGTDKLMAMNPVTHGWKADPEADTVHGFIAQEMMNIVPEAVSGDPEGEEMMSMDYGRITPVIVAALQDALKEIKELKTRINELENK